MDVHNIERDRNTRGPSHTPSHPNTQHKSHSHTGFTHKERPIPTLTKDTQTNLTHVHKYLLKNTNIPSYIGEETNHTNIYAQNTHHKSKDTKYEQITHKDPQHGNRSYTYTHIHALKDTITQMSKRNYRNKLSTHTLNIHIQRQHNTLHRHKVHNTKKSQIFTQTPIHKDT